jgi:hypothetical protein
MITLNSTHQAIFDKISKWIKEIFGDFANRHPEAPLYTIHMGSAIVFVGLHPWTETEATVNARAFVVTGVEITSELMEFLLKANNNMRFGGFGLDDDNDIFFEQTILGSTCDREELKSTVMAVLSVADQMDDEIVSRWGGMRALDQVNKQAA